MFQFPGFPSYSYVFTARSLPLRQSGFPIRKSAGQSPCPAHRSLSQVVTSFVGSRCQGIRPVLFLAWTLLRNFFRPVLSFGFYPWITWVSQTIVSVAYHFFQSKDFLCALLTYRHLKWRNHSFLPSTNKKTFVFSLISIICSFYSFLIRFSMNTISFQPPLSDWWAQVDSNHRPRAYQARALTTWAMSPYSGGDEGNRTPDLLLARQALSHLSYTPELLLLLDFAQ